MRVLITAFGTRGDVQPYIALAHRLREFGHEPTLAIPEGFRSLAESRGVPIQPAGSRMLDLVQEVLPTLSGPRDALKTLRVMREGMQEHIDDQLAAAESVDPDIVVHHPKCLAGPALAEYCGVPEVASLPLPFYTPTRAFPNPLVSTRDLGPVNRVTYAMNRMGAVMYGGMIREFRARLGLPARSRFADPLRTASGAPVHVLHPYSTAVVPRPADYPATAHVTGYWTLPGTAESPDPRIADFLETGPEPVYVGFGSMGFGKGAEERRDAVFGALAAVGVRGIVATGWGGIAAGEPPSKDVLVVEGAPHEWLFPRVRAVVHHGGAGTTAAGLAAGRPTLVCPFLGDQPFWGRRVHRIGAGPQPVPAPKLRQRLAGSLSELVGTPGYAERARRISQQLAEEDGTRAAVRVLEEIVGGGA